MKKKIIFWGAILIGLSSLLLAAASSDYILDPVSIDQGGLSADAINRPGEYDDGTYIMMGASVGGSVFDGTVYDQDHGHDTGFLAMMEDPVPPQGLMVAAGPIVREVSTEFDTYPSSRSTSLPVVPRTSTCSR